MEKKRKEKRVLCLVGILTGFLNGLFGSGGGTVVVPALERFLGLKEHRAHATALAVILPLSVLSLVIYLLRADGTAWGAAASASLGGFGGGILGAWLLPKLGAVWLHRVFGLFLILAAGRLLL